MKSVFQLAILYAFLGVGGIFVMPSFAQLVEIENKIPKSAPIKIEYKNQDSDNWVHDLEIRVTNTSRKPIYFLALSIILQDLKSEEGNPWGFPLDFGNHDLVSNSKIATLNDVAIAPEDTYTFKIRDKSAAAWTRRKDSGRVPESVKARIVLHYLSFGDGSGVKSGGTMVNKKLINFFQSVHDPPQKRANNFMFIGTAFLKPPAASMGCNSNQDKISSVSLVPNFINSSYSNAGDDCFTCTSGNGCPNAYWTAMIYDTTCQHCDYSLRATFLRPVNSDCYSPQRGCYFIADINEPCDMPGTPPIPSVCTYHLLTECEPEVCIDNDKDDYYDEIEGNCRTGPFDCDDDDENINPGMPEICDDEDLNDENCDGKKNCEDENCRLVYGDACDEQCDQDEDGFYSIGCGGGDCMDNPDLQRNAANIFPGQDQENTEELCSNGVSDDCDWEEDCLDPDCAQFCPTPTPTPDPGPEPPPECPCNNCDTGCGGCDCNDCVNGCEPNCEWVTVQGQCYETSVCWEEYDAYRNQYIITCEYSWECEPDQTIWVCY